MSSLHHNTSSDALEESLNIEDGSSVASNTSSHRSSSLLERIRLQRQREEQGPLTPPGQVDIPNYSQTQQEHVSLASSNFNVHGGQNSQEDHQDFFHTAWNNIQNSLEMGMATAEDGMESLLPPSSVPPEEYSMTQYFITFVKDIYMGFLRLHMVARCVLVIGLLYLAVKLL
jgi:hypothetical protein